MKTAVDRQRSGATRTAKSRTPHPAYQVQLAVYKSEKRAEKGQKVILCRVETSPEDIRGMTVASGILTARGMLAS